MILDTIFQFIQTKQIPVSLFCQTYNGSQYQMGMTIFYMDMELPYTFQITQQAFEKLVIRNSLDGFYPTAIVTFKDFNGTYTSHLRYVGQYIRIAITPPSTSQIPMMNNLDLYFSIEDHKMVAYNNKEITYELHCKFWTAKNFGIHLNYATPVDPVGASKLPPFIIISNLLKQINYPLNPLNMPPPSLHRIFYITDQNETVKDAIQHCLYYACDQMNPPTYLYHHLIDNQPVLYNQNFISKIAKYKANMGLSIITDDGVADVEKELVIQNPILFSNNPSVLHHQEKALYIQWKYDHLLRVWTQDVYSTKMINQLLTIPDQMNPLIKSSFYPETYLESGIRTYQFEYHSTIYQKLKDLDLNTNNIQFSVMGNIVRDVGQLICINSKQKNYDNSFGGLWQIYSILHIFSKDKYTNNIIGYRTFSMNQPEDTFEI